MAFLWKLTFMAAAVICSFAMVQSRTMPASLVRKVFAEQDELQATLEGSVIELRSAAEGMGQNFEKFVHQAFDQRIKDLKDYLPHLKALYNAVPAKAFKKFILQIMTTLLKQSEDHCGKIFYKYNPFHPTNSMGGREKRSTEAMDLTKFGKILSNVIGNFDVVVHHAAKSVVPALCTEANKWLQESIQEIEAKAPEELKKEWN